MNKKLKLPSQQANQLQDKQAQAYALGYLGGIYQQTGRLTEAQQFTEQALLTIDNTFSQKLLICGNGS